MIESGTTGAVALGHVRPHEGLRDGDFLAFAIPLGLCFEIHAIGEIFPADFLVLITFALLLVSGRLRIPDKNARITLALFAVWLVGQIITDAVRGTSADDIVRGWAMIIMSAVSFVAIYVLIGDQTRRLLLFAAGLAAGIVIRYFVDPSVFASGHPWKFGYGFAVTLAMLLAAVAIRRSRLIASAVMIFAGSINLIEGARSMALVCVTAAAIVLGRQVQRAVPRLGSVLPLAVLLAASIGVAHGYDSLARSGALGLKAQEKYKMESHGALGVVLGGRWEVLAALLAIRDTPILGHGSWARDPNYTYTAQAEAIMASLGYPVIPPTPQNDPVLPSHSHVLGAWVDAGVLGAVFWIWIAWLAARAIFAIYRSEDACSPLVAFLVCSLLWDLFFSPYGAERRIITPYYIVAAIMILRRPQLERLAREDLNSHDFV